MSRNDKKENFAVLVMIKLLNEQTHTHRSVLESSLIKSNFVCNYSFWLKSKFGFI